MIYWETIWKECEYRGRTRERIPEYWTIMRVNRGRFQCYQHHSTVPPREFSGVRLAKAYAEGMADAIAAYKSAKNGH
jgi:hypothetical protein